MCWNTPAVQCVSFCIVPVYVLYSFRLGHFAKNVALFATLWNPSDLSATLSLVLLKTFEFHITTSLIIFPSTQASSLEAQHQEMLSRVSNYELGMESLENELSSTKAAFEETKRTEEEMRLEVQRAVDEKAKLEVVLVDADKAREEELETLREAKHALIADKIQLGNKVESLEADLEAKREDLKTMLAETSEVGEREGETEGWKHTCGRSKMASRRNI